MSGSKGTFYTIEVHFTHGNERKRYYARNFTPQKLKEFREVVFIAGYAYPDPDDANHYILISPWNIIHIDVWRQKKFFKDE